MKNNILNKNKNRIYIPQILIPKYCDIATESSVGLKGELEWRLIETKRFSRPTVIMSGRQKNIIVNAGLDAWCNSTNSIGSYFSYIGVGTGSSTPSVTQTALDAQIARKQLSSGVWYYGPPPYYERECTFLESEANGDLTEWGAFQYSSGAPMFSRELFRDEAGSPIVIPKTNTQQLWLKYRLYIQRLSDFTSVNKVIDGITYICVSTVNDKQLYSLAWGWYAYSGFTRIVTGTSNAASDLINDNQDTIKGTLLFNGYPSISPTSSHPGTNQRQIAISLANTESNGQIGEMLISWSLNSSTGMTLYAGRVTFNPTLPKDSTKKLVVTVLYSFSNGS